MTGRTQATRAGTVGTAALTMLFAVAVLTAPLGAAPAGAQTAPTRSAKPDSALSPRLTTLATPAVQGSPEAAQDRAAGLPAEGPGSLLRRPDGRLHVDVRLSSMAATTDGTLTAVGAQVLATSASTHLATVAIAADDLDRLAALDTVDYATEVLAPKVAGTGDLPPGGATTSACGTQIVSEGDTQLAASAARATYGVDGTGVRVGILSDSYGNVAGGAAADVTAGELPGATNPCGRTTPVTVQADIASGGSDEGRGMAQLVHDLAPGSPLTFATAYVSEVDFANQIRNLATNGAKVIVDDISYFDEPVYQDGIVAKAISDITAAGVAYFSSAGNGTITVGGQSVGSYEAPAFRPTACPSSVSALGLADCHDFDTGAASDAGDTITVPNGGTIMLKLGYNQPENGITTDFDIALVDNTSGAVVAKSTANNLTSKKAYELFSYTNSTGGSRSYDIVVGRYGSGPVARFKLFFLDGSLSAVQYNTSTGGDVLGPTAYGHNQMTGAGSIAAVPYNNSNTVEYFSSRGPATYCYGPVVGTTVAAALPACVTEHLDVAATDGAANSFFGQLVSGVWRFYGTSAAAPHAAAVAALQRQARPCRTPAEVLAAQRASGRAIGAFGIEAMGSGLVHAGNAIANLAACGSAPGAPTGVSATAGAGQATVTWAAPASDGGSPITGYRITPSIGAAPQAPVDVPASPLSKTVTGLTNGTAYTFTVAAINAIGTGAASTASAPVTPATVPGAPTGVTATAGDGQVSLSWSAPASDGGSPVTGYVVTPSIAGTPQTPLPFASAATNQTISGLVNGTTYTFAVQATNGVGTGSASSSSDPVTPAGPATAPTGVAGTPGDGLVTLTWSAPASDGGSAVTGYRVTPAIGGVDQPPVDFAGTATTQDITGLANGTAYTFVVAATTSAGTGAASLPSAPVTPRTAPGAPSTVTGTPGNAKVTLTWSAPASDGGSPVTGYRIIPSIGGTPQPPIDLVGTATAKDVTGLVNGTTYTFTVQATNAAGSGVESAPSAPVTAGSPSAPTFQSAAPGNTTAKVSWFAPATNGSVITGYTITPYIGAAPQVPVTFNSTLTTQTITGLLNGTAYTFRVAAINARGTGAAATTAAVTVGTPTVPGFPAAVPGDGTAKVSWLASTANASPITGYTVTPYIGATPQGSVTFSSTLTTQTVSGLTNGASYTFKVTANNALGAGPASTTAAINVGSPLAPAFQSATPGDGSAKVGWYPNGTNGSPITGYVITPVAGSTVLPSVTFNSTASNQTITGLTNGTTYTFKVTAINARGTGATSTTAAVIVGSPAAPSVQAPVPGASSAKITWTAPAANGSAITGYKVTPYIGATAQTTVTFTSTATATTQTIAGLTNGTTYTFKVSAINARGTGPTGTSAAVTAGAPTVPAFPTAQPGNGTAKLFWFAPIDNGSAITGYTVTPYIGTAAQPTVTFASSATTQTVTGLANGTTYTFKVAAMNARGTGPASTTAAITVGAPTSPIGVTAVAGPGSATVSWGAPADNGSAITGYVITPIRAGVAQAPIAYASTLRTQVVTGLVTGAGYTFKVTAVNGVGSGPPSAASSAVVPT